MLAFLHASYNSRQMNDAETPPSQADLQMKGWLSCDKKLEELLSKQSGTHPNISTRSWKHDKNGTGVAVLVTKLPRKRCELAVKNLLRRKRNAHIAIHMPSADGVIAADEVDDADAAKVSSDLNFSFEDAKNWIGSLNDAADGEEGDDEGKNLMRDFSKFPRFQFYKAFGGAAGLRGELEVEIQKVRVDHKRRLAERIERGTKCEVEEDFDDLSIANI